MTDEIHVGDRVRVEFWPRKNDLCGDVVYVPQTIGDSWIIRAEDRVFYVQHFATISKRINESGLVSQDYERGFEAGCAFVMAKQSEEEADV